MKAIIIIFFIFIVSILITFIALAQASKSEKAPGLIKGLLLKCPEKPNCVCSEYKDDKDHFIEPVSLDGKRSADIKEIFKKIIIEEGGEVKSESENYLWTVFTSSIFKFKDDLEIRVDPDHKLIHLRSASRSGYSDFGVNRKRVEQIKSLFYKRLRSN